MDGKTNTIDHRELLEQMGWVQGLARSLVRDPNRASDVAQQTWVTALERPPRSAHAGRGLRAWLATVTRTAARQSMRSDARRRAREAIAMERCDETELAAADVVARAELQRVVVDAVMEIDEPYRRALLRRFFDGASTASVAEEEGISEAAVRKRVSRGLALVRARLERVLGGGGWVAVLWPLTGWRGDPPGALEPAVLEPAVVEPLVTTTAASAWVTPIVALAVLIAVSAIFVLGDCDSSRSHGVTESPVADTTLVDPLRAGPGDSPALRDAVGTPTPVAPARPFGAMPQVTPTERRVTLRARVVDPSGRPVAGVRMRHEPTSRSAAGNVLLATTTAVTDDSGVASFKLVSRRGRVFTATPDWTTVFVGHAVSADVDVVAARVSRLAGRVLDEHGRGVSGARLRVVPHASLLSRARVDRSESMAEAASEVTVGSQGEFDFDAPRLDDASLVVRARGFPELVMPVPARSELALEIVLGAVPEGPRGRVVVPEGVSFDDVIVRYGPTTLVPDGAGNFCFEPVALPWALTAVAPGFQPVTRLPDFDVDSTPAWPGQIVLTVREPAGAVRGRVVDSQGAPLAGLSVWLANPQVLFEVEDDPDVHVELSSGAQRAGDLIVVESAVAGEMHEDWLCASTDCEGRFELRGLQRDRAYRLGVMNPWTLTQTTSARTVRAGDDVTIDFANHADHRAVAGRVVTRDGDPIPGAVVTSRIRAAQIGSTEFFSDVAGSGTDANGVFEIHTVAREALQLSIEHPDYLTRCLTVPPHMDDSDDIVIERRVDLRAELTDPAEADSLRVVDAEGRDVDIITRRQGRYEARRVLPLVAGRSMPASVGDTAAAVVFLLRGRDVRRVPLVATPGDTLIVR